ncbi:MAG: GFA family protein [Alphaproteobacteria bacterium]
MGNVTGGCLCGTVRYSSNADPVMTFVCHCAHCQKHSGSAFLVFVAVPRDTLQIRGDTLGTYNDIGDSGQPVYRKFCGECGSPILMDAQAMPDLLFINAGTLDETDFLNPQTHVWCEQRQQWVKLDDDVQRFDRNPPTG